MTNDRIAEYVDFQRAMLGMLEQMWADPMVQCYNDDRMPDRARIGSSAFLAGPTSRNQLLEYRWRCKAVAYLRESGFDGYIFVPEPRGQEKQGDFTERGYIHHWESTRLMAASHVLFWIPRDDSELLGLNTNLELGIFLGISISANERGLEFFGIGWPDDAKRMGLVRHYMARAGYQRFETLRGLCVAAANQ